MAGDILVDGVPVGTVDDGSGNTTRAVNVNLVAGDIQIGAVEIKNGASDARAVVAAGTAIVPGDNALAVHDAVSDGYGGAPVTVTRPANMTPYSIGDVVGGAIDLGVMGPSAGRVLITGVSLRIDIAAIPAGMTNFIMHLYSVTPPSAIADNALFDLPSGDRASYLGTFSVGSPVDLGATLYVETNQINKQVLLAGTHLFAYLVTPTAYTPAANSEVYNPMLATVAL